MLLQISRTLRILTALMAMMVAGSAVSAISAGSAEQDKAPVAENDAVQKLSAFVGEWKLKDDAPNSPTRTICQWAPNKRCLLCDQIHPGPDGPVKELNIFTYDRAQAAYVMLGLHPQRRAPFAIDGQTWIYGGDNQIENGHTIKNRVLNVWESPAVMHFLVQSSNDDGKTWKTNFEGRLVRTAETPVASAPAPASAAAAPPSPLDPLVGTWQRGGPSDAFAATTTCGWSPNHAFLVCDQVTMARNTNMLFVYSLPDSAAKAGSASTPFLVQMANAQGGPLNAFDGTITNGAWAFIATPPEAGGQQFRTRVTRTFTDADTIQGREETSGDGTTWTLRAEFTETRRK